MIGNLDTDMSRKMMSSYLFLCITLLYTRKKKIISLILDVEIDGIYNMQKEASNAESEIRNLFELVKDF